MLFLILLPVSDRLGFGLMDADAMVTKAVNWTHVSEQQECTMPKQNRVQ